MFEIPVPRLPTEEELADSARKRLALVKDTYLENWPAALKALSIGQVGFPLATTEHHALLGALICRMDGSEDGLSSSGITLTKDEIKAGLARIEVEIGRALAHFPEGAFVRLGSRSPKDSFLGMKEGFRVRDAQHAMALILDSMERMYDDLAMAKRADHTPHVFLRSWKNIPPWAEFRCFMVGRELVGISQYDYVDGKQHASIVANAGGYAAAIRKFFPKFREACHLDDVTFDIAFLQDETPVLLEINPCVTLGITDPCLFRKGELDGSFRYIGDGRSYDWIRPQLSPVGLAALMGEALGETDEPQAP